MDLKPNHLASKTIVASLGVAFKPPFKSAFGYIYTVMTLVALIIGGGSHKTAVDQAFVDVIAQGRHTTTEERQSILASLRSNIPESWGMSLRPVKPTHGLVWSVLQYFKVIQGRNTNAMSLYHNADRVLDECGLHGKVFDNVLSMSWFNPDNWSEYLKHIVKPKQKTHI